MASQSLALRPDLAAILRFLGSGKAKEEKRRTLHPRPVGILAELADLRRP